MNDDGELWRAVEDHLIRYGGAFSPFLVARAKGRHFLVYHGNELTEFDALPESEPPDFEVRLEVPGPPGPYWRC